jgi:hypothetical protein
MNRKEWLPQWEANFHCSYPCSKTSWERNLILILGSISRAIFILATVLYLGIWYVLATFLNAPYPLNPASSPGQLFLIFLFEVVLSLHGVLRGKKGPMFHLHILWFLWATDWTIGNDVSLLTVGWSNSVWASGARPQELPLLSLGSLPLKRTAAR